MNNRRAKTSLKKYTSHFIVTFVVWEGVGDRTELQYIDPTFMALCLSCSPALLNRRPGGSAFCWVLAFSTTSYHQLVRSPNFIGGPRGPLRLGVAFPTTSCLRRLWSPTQSGAPTHLEIQGPSPPGFLYHILSATSLDPNSIGGPEGPFGLVWLSLLHLVSNSVRSLTVWLLVLTELYNSSTPTQSLEWRVWSSSSGNNCHAVQRSLSSGASVYECIMGFTLSHFISQIRSRDFFLLLAIGMCHFLPAYHFGMACLAESKVKIQHYFIDRHFLSK